MTQTAAQAGRKTLSTRLGTSPKTLHRKAMEKAAAAPVPFGEGLEELFPSPSTDADVGAVSDKASQQAADDSAAVADGVAASADQAAAAPAVDIIESSALPQQGGGLPASPPSTVVEDQSVPVAPVLAAPVAAWSDQDERAFQAMSARRKAAGFQRRGRDVSGQRIKVGSIAPNANTVVATIVAIVGERGLIARGELIDLMGTAAFASAKAKPTDRDWCTGYIAGAMRDGFLTLVGDGEALGESSPDAPRPAA